MKEVLLSRREKKMKSKDATEEFIKTKCDFCGKEMECPKNMLDLKQCCFNCFRTLPEKMKDISPGKLHIDIPLNEADGINEFIAEDITERIFPQFWRENKEELKLMSKKDVAREMFASGVLSALDSINKTMEKETINDDSIN